MNKKLKEYISLKFYTRTCAALLLGMTSVLPVGALAQHQLTASGKVTRVAYIDHSRLRKEFKEFAAAWQKLGKENTADKKSMEQALELLDKQTKEQLTQDSLNGGGSRSQIISLDSSRRSEIIQKNQLEQAKRNQDRITLMQEYEQKINAAIDAVVAEGGFTDVRPLIKDQPDKKRGIEITDLLLKKLN